MMVHHFANDIVPRNIIHRIELQPGESYESRITGLTHNGPGVLYINEGAAAISFAFHEPNSDRIINTDAQINVKGWHPVSEKKAEQIMSGDLDDVAPAVV